MKTWFCMMGWLGVFVCAACAQPAGPEPTVQQGVLELPAGISLQVATPDGTDTFIEPVDGTAKLPVGTYKLRYWIYQKTDTDGNTWKLHGYGNPPQTFQIGDEPVKLNIKPEPITAELQVRCQGDYVFIETLKGPAGERVYLYKNRDSSAPPIVITNEAKTFSVTLTGSYG